MKKQAIILSLGLALTLSLPWVLLAAPAPADKPAVVPAAAAAAAPAIKVGTTLENLQAAFNGESNAQAKYLAFATKAKAEGYLKVAKLFRATAMAEGIHAQHHADAIKSLGGKAEAKLEKPVVGTTQQNLETSLKGENYENDVMYPAYIQKAVTDKDIKAQHSFGGAKVVEAIHAKLYAEALANLPAWKANGDFYVCEVCGNVVEKLGFEYCSICKAPVSEFVKLP
jgi:rubrerythrin